MGTGRRDILVVPLAKTSDPADRRHALCETDKAAIRRAAVPAAILGAPRIILRRGGNCKSNGSGENCEYNKRQLHRRLPAMAPAPQLQPRSARHYFQTDIVPALFRHLRREAKFRLWAAGRRLIEAAPVGRTMTAVPTRFVAAESNEAARRRPRDISICACGLAAAPAPAAVAVRPAGPGPAGPAMRTPTAAGDIGR